MNSALIDPVMIRKINEQAESEYPQECCGLILGPIGQDGLTRLQRCTNVYRDFHERDPKTYPRSARTAYLIDPQELLAILKESRRQEEEIKIIYHSHIDSGAYFSDEDKLVAAPEGEPVYPGVKYLVVSVKNGKVDAQSIFCWDEKEKDFIS